MTGRHYHLCCSFINAFNLVYIVEIKLRVNALSPHIKCQGNNINITRSFSVAKKCALNSVSTCKKPKFCCGNTCTPVVMRMKRNNSCITIWKMAAEIFNLVSITVRS